MCEIGEKMEVGANLCALRLEGSRKKNRLF